MNGAEERKLGKSEGCGRAKDREEGRVREIKGCGKGNGCGRREGCGGAKGVEDRKIGNSEVAVSYC